MRLRKKRILLLSEGFGAGHTQAAHALAVSLRQLYPEFQTRVLELGTFLHPTLAPFIFNAYRKTVSSQPKLYGKLYRFQYKKSLNPLTQLALHQLFYRQTSEVIKHLKPDIIVCTHPFPNVVVSRLKRSGLSIPLVTVVTDYDLHGTWVDSEVNKYLIPTNEVKTKLLRRGVPERKIEVTGIPVHPSFWQRHDRSSIRDHFKLKAMPTVLVMGGGWGLVGEHSFFDDMVKWREQIQFVFCLGSNEKALQKMSENPGFQHDNIRLMGFTKEIDKLMEISHLLITKPGGITCTEGLAKGIPMLFYKPIPGQEEDNLQYFTENGYGEQITSCTTINNRFQLLISEYQDVGKYDVERPKIPTDMSHPYPPEGYSKAIAELLM
ncbi:UDP-N-acetylglucosamine--LPS N-acetylglucosamine transferase [Paenibacillus sp. N1-5-1-14]|uniref:MGDG synthase family glycosyltransferase n=1 Tax=Paenibacillus radicibacter TaxID=2972488 RepID=UPI002159769C|nr:glycosyltransferase [Paenibacillus radicibacter]MCR8645637.1 UDP-N-acetylglucosamine--LPS N-acetylglucosamine transferase [Paenibacillus radicibacter]